MMHGAIKGRTFRDDCEYEIQSFILLMDLGKASPPFLSSTMCIWGVFIFLIYFFVSLKAVGDSMAGS